MKHKISIDDAYDDFGFSAVSEEELKAKERALEEKTAHQNEQIITTTKSYQEKLDALYTLVMPFLLNLLKSPEKEYLYWPRRSEVTKEFIQKIESIVNKQ